VTRHRSLLSRVLKEAEREKVKDSERERVRKLNPSYFDVEERDTIFFLFATKKRTEKTSKLD
jgi:hypothetical protein